MPATVIDPSTGHSIYFEVVKGCAIRRPVSARMIINAAALRIAKTVL
jgi:hypothetical protein